MKGRRIPYSAEELAFIEAHRSMNRRELLAAFVVEFRRTDVTYESIHSLCSRRGWTADRRRPWTGEDDARLRELYPHVSSREVARRMGRTLCAVYGRADKLGLAKTEAYLASPDACRLRRGDHVGAAYQFRKGHVPANKGTRRPGWGPGRMKETQFKKGHSTRKMPIGSERLVDGYRYTKISDTPNVPWTRNWKVTHVLNWEKANGPVPEGHALKSRDGDRLNVDPANWICIPRALLPRLNGIRGRGYDSAPAELKPVILATAKLEHAAREASLRKTRQKARTT